MPDAQHHVSHEFVVRGSPRAHGQCRRRETLLVSCMSALLASRRSLEWVCESANAIPKRDTNVTLSPSSAR
jgi:hypothetical protein